MNGISEKTYNDAKQALILENKIKELKKEIKKIKLDYDKYLETCRIDMESKNLNTLPIDNMNKLVFKNKVKSQSLSKDFIKMKLRLFCMQKIKGVDADQLSNMMTEFLLEAKKKNNKTIKIICIKSDTTEIPDEVLKKRKLIEEDEVFLNNKKSKLSNESNDNQESQILDVLRQ